MSVFVHYRYRNGHKYTTEWRHHSVEQVREFVERTQDPMDFNIRGRTFSINYSSLYDIPLGWLEVIANAQFKAR